MATTMGNKLPLLLLISTVLSSSMALSLAMCIQECSQYMPMTPDWYQCYSRCQQYGGGGSRMGGFTELLETGRKGSSGGGGGLGQSFEQCQETCRSTCGRQGQGLQQQMMCESRCMQSCRADPMCQQECSQHMPMSPDWFQCVSCCQPQQYGGGGGKGIFDELETGRTRKEGWLGAVQGVVQCVLREVQPRVCRPGDGVPQLLHAKLSGPMSQQHCNQHMPVSPSLRIRRMVGFFLEK